MSTPQNLSSIFPDLPRETPVIDEQGNFTELWALGLSDLFQALQTNYKNEGILIPPLSAANIAIIQSIYTPFYTPFSIPLSNDVPDISGQTVFDTTNRVLKQFVITYDASNPPNVVSAQWVIVPYLIFASGSPLGTQAGQQSWLYYDFIGKILYICTIAGNAATAVWTPI